MSMRFRAFVWILQHLMERPDGQDLAEYVLLGGLVSIAVVAASNQVAAALIAAFTKAATTLT
jgi:Flp pilus assembly pilin Flp